MRINIMGSACPGWEDTPYYNGEVWSVNDAHILRPVDLVVDIHIKRLNPIEEQPKFDKKHLELLREKEIPAYFVSEIEGYPNIKKYPIEEILKEFGSDYFGSGIDYIIALAIYKGATEIHIYGVYMVLEDEYSHQKPSLEYWIGFARGRGISVEVHGDKTELLLTRSGYMYGYQTLQAWREKYPRKEMTLDQIIAERTFTLKEQAKKGERCGLIS